MLQKKTEQFLHQAGMHYDTLSLAVECKKFIAEMRRGLSGEDSSLLMLPTYIQAGGELPLGRRILVMDAGGTNFRVAAVEFLPEGPQISGFNKYPMPGTWGRVSREEFFDTIVRYMLPLIDTSETVGFCFSFPTEIQPDHDGRVIRFSKEVYVDDVEGQLLGEGLNQALARQGIGPRRFVLLNDTVATMLGGIADRRADVFDGHVGYILGTGTNTCYLEDCAGIVKAPQAQACPGQMTINMESAGYTGIAQGQVDRELDQSTINPGQGRFEKMISGYYQGTVIYRTVRLAVQAGLFSAAFAARLEKIPDFGMADIDQFCFHPYSGNLLSTLCAQDDADRLTLYELIDTSFERAARLTAINMAAILEHTDSGISPVRPVCITAEGTTFYKSKLFRGKLDYYVRTFIEEQLGRYCEFNRTEDVTLIGTAAAGLLN